MNLQVGLTHDVPAWRLLLDQEKIPYQIINGETSDQVDQTKFPVILLTGVAISRNLLSRYLRNGGVVIADQASKKLIEDIGAKDQTVILDVDIKDTIRNQKSCSKRFVFRNEGLVEEVASIQKSQIRRKLADAIKQAFWRLKLPYVHIWYFPDGADSMFTFRIDFDEYGENEFYQICNEIKPYTPAISSFLCMRSYEKLDHALKRLISLEIEIGSHGYIHHVYQSYEQNNWNLEKAEKLLLPYVKRVNGFCAPHGLWNPFLQRVLEDRGYEYSSEFGLNYDDFPFFPISDEKCSGVLQIPVHPISEGVFGRGRRLTDKLPLISAYFQSVIDYKMRIKEPIFLYGHPAECSSIFRNMFDQVRQKKNIIYANFNAISKWWKMRHNVRTDLEYEKGILKSIAISGYDRRVMLEILTFDNKRMLLPLDQLEKGVSINEASVTYVSVQDHASTLCGEIREVPLQSSVFYKLKRWIKNKIDWEIKTPLSMIKVLDMRSFIKYMMRICHNIQKLSRNNP